MLLSDLRSIPRNKHSDFLDRYLVEMPGDRAALLDRIKYVRWHMNRRSGTTLWPLRSALARLRRSIVAREADAERARELASRAAGIAAESWIARGPATALTAVAAALTLYPECVATDGDGGGLDLAA
ncbi:MAG: hypothetical protein C0606_11110 [Hyphomicrobiales bacterium]|nr:MAG: hypothetical protein C0606_11110 [Hyphomicrobiales bacterium]